MILTKYQQSKLKTNDKKYCFLKTNNQKNNSNQ